MRSFPYGRCHKRILDGICLDWNYFLFLFFSKCILNNLKYDFKVRNMSNDKNKQTLRKPVWQDILFRTCMEVRFITAVTRGLFFASPF